MRYLIKFTKNGNIKFISHLDLMRTIQRIIRRSELPIEYSKGFNPHMSISIAQPLSVGMYSLGEYMDIVLVEELEESYIKERLSENVPSGISIVEVVKVQNDGEKKVPQSMALIDGAEYEITIKYEDTNALAAELKELLNKADWTTMKKSKSGEKLVDIKPMVKDFKYEIDESMLKINAVISCGSRENLSAELLSDYVKQNTTSTKNEAFVDIRRNELLTLKGGKLVPIYKAVK